MSAVPMLAGATAQQDAASSPPGLVSGCRPPALRLGVTTFGTDGGASGIGRYTRALLAEFARPDVGLSLEVIGAARDRRALTNESVTYRAVPDRWATPVRNMAWHRTVLPSLARRRGFDVLFIPAGNRRLPGRLSCPTVGTVHDLSQLHVAAKYNHARQFYARHVLPTLIRSLTHVITVSESSKRDIIDHAGVPEERISVIPNGVDLDRFHPRDRESALAEVQRRLGFQDPFLLYVARLEHPGKNHVRLIRAFELFKQLSGAPHRLVLAGPPWTRAETVHAAATGSAFSDEIHLTGFVDGDFLPALYVAAEALVFPSLYEGFGIPLLEAMASGTAIAAARCSSLPEVGGDAVLYFDPEEPEDMTSCMLRLVADPQLRETLVGQGLERVRRFSWAHSAARTLEVLRRAARSW